MEDTLCYNSPNLVGFFKVILVARLISEHLSLAQATNNFELNLYENDHPSMTLILCIGLIMSELKDFNITSVVVFV